MTAFDRAEFRRQVPAVIDGERDHRLIERLLNAAGFLTGWWADVAPSRVVG